MNHARPTTSMLKPVFLSYCSEDQKLAREICQRLEHAGIGCWIAPRDVVAGKEYGEQIIAAIEETALMVVVLSRACNASLFVKNEVERAISKRKTVITFRIEHVEPSKALELFLAGRQWIDAWEDPLLATRELAASIHALTAQSPHDELPSSLPPPSRGKRRWGMIALAGGAAVLIGGGLLLGRPAGILRGPTSTATPVAQSDIALPPRVANTPVPLANKISVMTFEKQHVDDPQDEWFGKGLQAALNTKLSQVAELHVIAPEVIVRTAQETGLDFIGAANRLGVKRVVAGSFWVKGGVLRVDLRIVDTDDYRQEMGETVEGSKDEFSQLQSDLTQKTLDDFHVQLTKSDEAAVKRTTNSHLDKYRLLLGAEGVTGHTAGTGNAPHEPETRGPTPASEPVGAPALSILLDLGSVAYAQTSPADGEAAVREVLEEYRRASERGNLDELASLYVSFSEDQRNALSGYLQGVKDLKVEFGDIKVQRRQHDIAVSYIRRDHFVDRDSDEPVNLEVRVTKFLVQDHGKWKFTEGG